MRARIDIHAASCIIPSEHTEPSTTAVGSRAVLGRRHRDGARSRSGVTGLLKKLKRCHEPS